MHPQIYLASQSPRRRELLEQIGIYPNVVTADIDECPHPDEAPAEYVIRLALEKAKAVHATLSEDNLLPVLAADTSVVVNNRILGKPQNRNDALAIMQQLSGRTHKVLTGVALVNNEKISSRLSVSNVTFRPVTKEEAQAYWESGEPQDKAGGYAIQGLGAMFISRLEGSYSGVMGLPLFETANLLQAAGVHMLSASTDQK